MIRTLIGAVAPRCLLGLWMVAAGCSTHPTRVAKLPFPEHTEPAVAISHALAEAGRSGRCVLLVFGANWCSDSRTMMERLSSDARLAEWVAQHLVTVPIDVGPRGGAKWDAEIVRQYDRPFAGRGIPALVVLDSTGRPLTTPATNPLKDSDHRHPKKVLRFLQTACETRG